MKTMGAAVLVVAVLTFSAEAADTQWRYHSSVDKMRGARTRVAEIASTNAVKLEFPYEGGTRLTIGLIQRDSEAPQVGFFVNRGQFQGCLDYCFAHVKFDSDPVSDIYLVESDSGRSDRRFLRDAEIDFIRQLRTARRITVEVSFFDHGSEQFDFKVAGLDWAVKGETLEGRRCIRDGVETTGNAACDELMR